jgi:hypothetical protein
VSIALSAATTRTPAFPAPAENLKRFGFKFPPGGPHISRTMMLHELTVLLDALPSDATSPAYVDAIVSKNLLGKGTESTRLKTLRHLRELYGLSPDVPIFRALRSLQQSDSAATPQLALLCAWTRDPLLRATTSAIFNTPEGGSVSASALAESISDTFPGQYSPLNQQKIARNARATWTYSGHLRGHTQKIRQSIDARPAAVAYALLLADISGLAGGALLSSAWCGLLDLSAEKARTSAGNAHRFGLLNFRAAGSVIEISFPSSLRS